MLNLRKTINMTGECVIDDTVVEQYTVIISPSSYNGKIAIHSNVSNHTLAKANRDICTADRTAFEDEVYSIIDEILAESADVAENDEDAGEETEG